jgi:hypothetical protein
MEHQIKNSFPLLTMIRSIFLAGLVVLLQLSGWALETSMMGVDREPLFSKEFLQELTTCRKDSNPIERLTELHSKSTKPEEQAEIELSIARIYNQITGYVDYGKAVEWYNKALVRDLLPIALTEQLILRGNSHESLGHDGDALKDYIRGLLACLRFRIPAKWPQRTSEGRLQPPPRNSRLEFGSKPNPEQIQNEKEQYADYWRENRSVDVEQQVMRSRYYYVDAIKRIMARSGMTEKKLRDAAEKLTNQQDRVEEILRRVREPNPRPWP